MGTSGKKMVWKIENFSSLSNKTHYSQVFNRWEVYWQLSIEPKGLQDETYESSNGKVITRNETKFVIGLSTSYQRQPLYVDYSLAVVNQKCKEQTRKYDMEREIHPEKSTLCEAMCLTELLDPEKGFIVDDICYIKVEIFSWMSMLKSIPEKPEIEPEPELEADWSWGDLFQELFAAVFPSSSEVTGNIETTDSGSVEATTQAAGDSNSALDKNTGENPNAETKDEERTKEKEDSPGSVETTTQAAGDSKSASNKNTGENQNTETKDEERSLSLSKWIQERNEDMGNYFNGGYQRLD